MSVPLVNCTHRFPQHDFGEYGESQYAFGYLFLITVCSVLEGSVVTCKEGRRVKKVKQ